jgi:protein kinase
MQNILLSGFESEPNNNETVVDSKITAKLGDLGIVMEPAKGLVQPIVYRAPEVYFRNEISPAADIWSWGLIYCQLLEAQASFNKWGLYDDLLQGTSQVQQERSVERAIAHDFGLGALDYYNNCALPYHDRTQHEGQHWERLQRKGVSEKEIQFLRWVLNPVPTDRPTAQEVLGCGWFTTDEGATGRIAESMKKSAEASRRRNLQRKGSEPLLYTRARMPPANPNLVVARDARAPIEVAAMTALPPPTPGVGGGGVQQTSPFQPMSSQKGGGGSHQPTPFEPMSFQPFQPTPRGGGEVSRPSTPRSSTQRPAGTTFMNYGSFMR